MLIPLSPMAAIGTGLAILLPAVQALPPRAALPTITLAPHVLSQRANVTALLESHLASSRNSSSPSNANGLDKRQSGVIGTGICATSMQGFSCAPENHESNRCAGDGDDWSYCICAGSASLPGRNPQGLWLNTAWGPECYACYDKPRGYEFDGTCNGDGTGGRGQSISEILRTLTIVITEWTYSTITDGEDDGGHHTPDPCYNGCNPPKNPAATVTEIVTVTSVSSTKRRKSVPSTNGSRVSGISLLVGLMIGSLLAS